MSIKKNHVVLRLHLKTDISIMRQAVILNRRAAPASIQSTSILVGHSPTFNILTIDLDPSIHILRHILKITSCIWRAALAFKMFIAAGGVPANIKIYAYNMPGSVILEVIDVDQKKHVVLRLHLKTDISNMRQAVMFNRRAAPASIKSLCIYLTGTTRLSMPIH